MYFVIPIQKSDSLVAGCAPVVQESLDEIGILNGDVVDVPVDLPVEGYRVGLALGADALGPRRVVLAAVLDAAGDVFEGEELAPVHS